MSECTVIELPLLADCSENYFAALGLLAVANRWDAEWGDCQVTKLSWSEQTFHAELHLPVREGGLAGLQAFMEDSSRFEPKFYLQPGLADCPSHSTFSKKIAKGLDEKLINRYESWGWDPVAYAELVREATSQDKLPPAALGGQNTQNGLFEEGYLVAFEQLLERDSSRSMYEDLERIGTANKPHNSSPWTMGGNTGQACVSRTYLKSLEASMDVKGSTQGFFDGVDGGHTGSLGAIHSSARYGAETRVSYSGSTFRGNHWRVILFVEGLALFQPSQAVKRKIESTGDVTYLWGFPWARGSERWMPIWSEGLTSTDVTETLCKKSSCVGDLASRLSGSQVEVFAVLSDETWGPDPKNMTAGYGRFRFAADIRETRSTPLVSGDIKALSSRIRSAKQDRFERTGPGGFGWRQWPKYDRVWSEDESKYVGGEIEHRKDEAANGRIGLSYLKLIDDGGVEFAVAACLVASGRNDSSMLSFLKRGSVPGDAPFAVHAAEHLVRRRMADICTHVGRGTMEPQHLRKIHPNLVSAVDAGELDFVRISELMGLLMYVKNGPLIAWLISLYTERSAGVVDIELPIRERGVGSESAPFRLRALCGSDPVSMSEADSSHRHRDCNRPTPTLREVHFGGKGPKNLSEL